MLLDVGSRRVMGWAMADHLRTEQALEALQTALWQRRHSALGYRSPAAFEPEAEDRVVAEREAVYESGAASNHPQSPGFSAPC
jgi:transposase InsO family protein